MPLENGVSTFFIIGNPIFSIGPKSLPKNPPDCPILSNRFFVNFILADQPFAKDLQSLKISVIVNKNL